MSSWGEVACQSDSIYLPEKTAAGKAEYCCRLYGAKVGNVHTTGLLRKEGTPIQFEEVAVAEITAVRDADVVVVLLPGGYGTHVEIGAALALEKPVILHAPDRETLETPYPCVFHYHPQVQLLVSEVLDVAEVLARIK